MVIESWFFHLKTIGFGFELLFIWIQDCVFFRPKTTIFGFKLLFFHWKIEFLGLEFLGLILLILLEICNDGIFLSMSFHS